MICPNCKIEMEKGNLTANGHSWVPQTKNKIMGFLTGATSPNASTVTAWKCSNCNKIELSLEVTI